MPIIARNAKIRARNADDVKKSLSKTSPFCAISTTGAGFPFSHVI